ncbi:MAG: SdpI family protein [Candidatus Micrarchaeota archaeon]
MENVHVAIIGIVLASFLLAAYIYPLMPEKIATHWGIEGKPNGYSGRLLGTFMMPAMLLLISIFLYYVPKLDPLKANVKKFREYFDRFILLLGAFLFYLQVLVVYWNLGNEFDFGQMLLPAFGVLFYYIGVLIVNAKRNWFIGIRTPWTLSSDRVWDKTHAIGGKLFKATGIIAFLGLFLPQVGFMLVIAMAIAIVVWSFVYSYVEFRNEERLNQNKKERKK